MNFFPAIWNVLHDGRIVALQGEVPGTIRFHVSIDYLRKRFSDPGETIEVTLNNCTSFAYQDDGSNEFTTDLPAIVATEPEILSAEMRGNTSVIRCVGGTLETSASDGSIMLDSARAITLQELIDVSESYWTEWSQVARQARQESP